MSLRYAHLMMLCVVSVWMVGQCLILPYVAPWMGDVLGACGLALTMCAVVFGWLSDEIE